MRVNPSQSETTDTECPLVTAVRRAETPMISELVAAMLHLERLAGTADIPEHEAAAQRTGITPEQHRTFVLGNADRIRRALDKITTPYTLPEAGARAAQGNAFAP